jgi:von Willebrand factor type A domain.
LYSPTGNDHTVDWRTLEQDPADRLRNLGVNIFTVGITPRADHEELQSLAGSETHVISLQGYEQLNTAIPTLVEKACTLASVVKRSESPRGSL